ncbi:MAG TPA: AraC family transcriptional regulator [Pyrinomonadaceae bacterium]|nr:AraC family transcriptional regulator [Pyrinomonadaceae bacterium]
MKGHYLTGTERAHSHLLPSYSLLAKAPPLTEVRVRSIYSRRLERLWAFIEEYYSEPDIRLTDAARHSGVSPDHLNLLLQRFVGTTFHHLLSRYRVEKCMELLHEKNYTLTEAYSRCGFNSPTTFDRQFKKWVGCLPREYKRSVTLLRELDSESAITISE